MVFTLETVVNRLLFVFPAVAKLSLYSGVLALGVGDSMAALCGKLFGKTKWPGLCKRVNEIHTLVHVHVCFIYSVM